MSHYYLPGIASKAKWEFDDRMIGAKRSIIEANEEVVHNRLEAMLDERLVSHSEAKGYRQLLGDTIN